MDKAAGAQRFLGWFNLTTHSSARATRAAKFARQAAQRRQRHARRFMSLRGCNGSGPSQATARHQRQMFNMPSTRRNFRLLRQERGEDHRSQRRTATVCLGRQVSCAL
jgi:hypothetical protein